MNTICFAPMLSMARLAVSDGSGTLPMGILAEISLHNFLISCALLTGACILIEKILRARVSCSRRIGEISKGSDPLQA